MKKIFIIIFLILPVIMAGSAPGGPKQEQEKDDSPMILIGGYDDEDYESEKSQPEQQKKSTEIKEEKATHLQSDKKTESVVKEKSQSKEEYIKTDKEQGLEKPVRAKLLKGYKRHYFESFEMDFPEKCEIRKEESDSASIKENSGCMFKGKIAAFTVKYSTKDLVNGYKERCKKENKKTLYKRWIQSPVYEGYISVCGEDEKEAMVVMEANSIKSNKSYRFIGETLGKFGQKTKQQIYLTFKSLWEK